ncbi:MAG: c-type cytochrome biogenesis protein CcmI [Candidatus Bipolaricaulia bacterium]
MFATTVGLLIAAAVGLYIFLPYFIGEEKQREEDPMDREIRREELMRELADLEYDLQTGKLRQADYEALRADLENQLVQLKGEPSDDR